MMKTSPERFTELHGEEKTEEGDRGDQEDKRQNQKERERKLGNNQFSRCSPQSESLKNVHSVAQRKEEGGRR